MLFLFTSLVLSVPLSSQFVKIGGDLYELVNPGSLQIQSSSNPGSLQIQSSSNPVSVNSAVNNPSRPPSSLMENQVQTVPLSSPIVIQPQNQAPASSLQGTPNQVVVQPSQPQVVVLAQAPQNVVANAQLQNVNVASTSNGQNVVAAGQPNNIQVVTITQAVPTTVLVPAPAQRFVVVAANQPAAPQPSQPNNLLERVIIVPTTVFVAAPSAPTPNILETTITSTITEADSSNFTSTITETILPSTRTLGASATPSDDIVTTITETIGSRPTSTSRGTGDVFSNSLLPPTADLSSI